MSDPAALASMANVPQSKYDVIVAEREALSLVSFVLGDSQCHTEYDTWPGVLVMSFLVLYCFVGLAIVCDEYFCESLEEISSALELSDDVAGATFMAAGSSAPELFTAVVSIFLAPGEQGVGTIVGSAVFNICVIVGVTALCSGQVLHLWWYPLSRDSFVYGISVLLMVWVMTDGYITLFESVVLVSSYALYVLWMILNSRIVGMLQGCEKARAERRAAGFELEVSPMTKLVGINPKLQPAFRVVTSEGTQVRRRVDRSQLQAMIATAYNVHRAKNKFLAKLSSRSSSVEKITMAGAEAEEEEGEKSCLDTTFNVVAWPLNFLMSLTIPGKRWYAIQFSMSIVWIGVLSFLMVDFATRVGCILGVPTYLMGLTVLAAGTSVPDALASVSVGRNGQGNMAVCNALGSNVFNILLGLGLPWMVVILLNDEPYHVGATQMLEPCIILFLYMLFFVAALIFFDWKLSPKFGVVLLIGQAMYWMHEISAEYHIGYGLACHLGVTAAC